MEIKAIAAPAHVVRAFLCDEKTWKNVYCEEEEFTRNGETLDDLQGVSDTDMVTITGGHVYHRKSGQDYVGPLEESFNQYLANCLTTVVVQVDAARQSALLELLKANGFEYSVADKETVA